MINKNPNEFISFLKDNGIQACYFIFKDGIFQASHSVLDSLATSISKMPDFKSHECLFIELDDASNSLLTAFVHSTVRGQAAGGVRLNNYDTLEALLMDGLRLSKGMADKNATARLWWGGGKGIIYNSDFRSLVGDKRKAVFNQYGSFISSLNGIYVTAEDMNTKPSDIADIFANTRYCTCIPVDKGGSSNPSTYTAKGVFSGIKAAADYKYGQEVGLKGKTVLLHGAGNVGYHVMEQCIEAGAKVYVFDINDKTLAHISESFDSKQVEIMRDEQAFFSKEANIFSANAIGAILHDETIANLNVEIVCGGANNQLLVPEKHSQDLHDRGIIYLPDFFVNRLGIINCANEQYGYVKADIDREVELVYTDSLDLLAKAESKKQSPFVMANEIAAERLKEAHPIWGHRGPQLVEEVIKSGFGKSMEPV